MSTDGAGPDAVPGAAPHGAPRVRHGVRIAVDVGSVRVGVARTDPQGILAIPVETLKRDEKRRTDIEQIVMLVREWDALEVVVGLPLGLSGAEGSAAGAARRYAGAVARAVAPVPVRLVDERLSTVSAASALRGAGVSTRKHRGVVDQAAAVVILQAALDVERASGEAPGSLVDPAPVPKGSVPTEGLEA